MSDFDQNAGSDQFDWSKRCWIDFVETCGLGDFMDHLMFVLNL